MEQSSRFLLFLLSTISCFGLVNSNHRHHPTFSTLPVSHHNLYGFSGPTITSARKDIILVVTSWRGGSSFEDGEQSDDIDDYEDEDGDGEEDDLIDGLQEDEENPPTEGYDHSLIDPPTDEQEPMKLGGSSSSSSSRRTGAAPDDNINRRPRRRGPPQPARRAKRTKHWSQRLASQSFKMGSQLAWGAVQQTGKVAYQLVKPRHVEARELIGIWRLDQQIVSNGRDMASVATVELDPRQRLVTLKLPNGKTVVEPFSFQKTRLGSFQTEFVAPAFLVGDTPRMYGYRGTWQRKLADKRVIKLVGKIYQVKKQRFGKSQGKYLFTKPVGTFVARRRMKLSDDDDEGGESFESESEEGYEGQGDEDLETDLSEGYDEEVDED